MNTDPLITSGDIAKLAGVSPKTVRCWPARHDDFPEYVAKAGNARLWRESDVEAWLEHRNAAEADKADK